MTHINTVRTEHIFDIVEILHVLGQLLSPPDLLACCQVSRHWNNVLIPCLWETIDDSQHSWSRILAHYDSEQGKALGQDEVWVKTIFAKYGEHIKNLTLSWRILIDSANEAPCSNLRSLHITNVSSKLTLREKVLQDRIIREIVLQDQNVRQIRTSNDPSTDQWSPAATGPYLSPEFEGVLQPSDTTYRPQDLQGRDWITMQNFWIMARRNVHLRSLRMSIGLRALCKITSDDFIQDVIGGLPELQDLATSFQVGDPYDFVARLRNLESLCTFRWSYRAPSGTLSSLKSLTIHEQVSCRQLFVLLRHFPSLESLAVRSLDKSISEDTSATIVDIIPSQLKRLTFSGIERAHHVGNNINLAEAVLPWVPHLEHIEFYSVSQDGARAILSHCQQLKSVVQSRDDFTIFAQLGQNAGHQFKVFAEFLRNCATLRVLTGPRQMLEVNEIVEYPWVSDQLETLRCQIGGLERLRSEEESIMEGITVRKTTAGVSSGEQEVLEKHARFLEQHRLVYERLATFVHLTSLDLSYELRSVRLAYQDSRHMAGSPLLVARAAKDRPLISDCLALTLESGLGLLAPLINLEMFGFSGIDHRMCKAELEWMAVHWLRLKTIRGLIDAHQPRSEHDRRNAMLREYMRALRPDVEHESVVPISSY
ncbi:hypothetical protein BGZ95_005621 [Linnemannia exigua]|uniref:F-box domain-containing protein n=1 Tax=Linnemannia exigua TaxID=604196 RepID=A0AAD4HBF3_9FUNG|nr:hypothetical protein BGZ95_005621 [Linnemannia exigua]